MVDTTYSTPGRVVIMRSSISPARACVTFTGVLLGRVMSTAIAPLSVRGMNSMPRYPPALNAPKVSATKTSIVSTGRLTEARRMNRKSCSNPL